VVVLLTTRQDAARVIVPVAELATALAATQTSGPDRAPSLPQATEKQRWRKTTAACGLRLCVLMRHRSVQLRHLATSRLQHMQIDSLAGRRIHPKTIILAEVDVQLAAGDRKQVVGRERPG